MLTGMHVNCCPHLRVLFVAVQRVRQLRSEWGQFGGCTIEFGMPVPIDPRSLFDFFSRRAMILFFDRHGSLERFERHGSLESSKPTHSDER